MEEGERRTLCHFVGCRCRDLKLFLVETLSNWKREQLAFGESCLRVTAPYGPNQDYSGARKGLPARRVYCRLGASINNVQDFVAGNVVHLAQIDPRQVS